MAPAAIQKKTVLITGCSTGSIGSALAKVFLEHDFHVFAGVRSRSKAQDLAKLSSVDVVELDVTVPQTISQCQEMVTKRTGGKLDVLVSSLIFIPRNPHQDASLNLQAPTFTNNCHVTRSTAPGSRGSARFST